MKLLIAALMMAGCAPRVFKCECAVPAQPSPSPQFQYIPAPMNISTEPWHYEFNVVPTMSSITWLRAVQVAP